MAVDILELEVSNGRVFEPLHGELDDVGMVNKKHLYLMRQQLATDFRVDACNIDASSSLSK